MPEEQQPQLIHQIKLTYNDGVNSTIEKEYNINTFDSVYYGDNYNYTLQDFFSTMQSFFSKRMHTYYGQSEPDDPIIEWYQIINND